MTIDTTTSDARRYLRSGIIRLSFAVVAMGVTVYAGSFTFTRGLVKNISGMAMMDTPAGKAIATRGAFRWEAGKCTEEAKLPPDQAPPSVGIMAEVRRQFEKEGKTINRPDSKRTPDQLYIDCLRREIGQNIISLDMIGLGILVSISSGILFSQGYKGAAFVHLSRKTARRRPYFKFKNPPKLLEGIAPGEGGAETLQAGEGFAETETKARPVYTAAFSIGDGYQPIVSVHLPADQVVFAERGALLAKSDGVKISSHVPQAPALKKMGRFRKRIRRMMTGEGVVLTRYDNIGKADVKLYLNTDTQTIASVALGPEERLIVQRGGFYAANAPVEIEPVLIPDFSFIVLGKQGMFLQSIRTDGDAQVLLESRGHVLEAELKDGEVLNVQPNSVLGFTAGVSVALAENRGLVERLKVGEDRFYVAFQGPGRVWMQTERAPRKQRFLGRFMPG